MNLDESNPGQPAPEPADAWIDSLPLVDQRMAKHIRAARRYAEDPYGAPGHLDALTIARLSQIIEALGLEALKG